MKQTWFWPTQPKIDAWSFILDLSVWHFTLLFCCSQNKAFNWKSVPPVVTADALSLSPVLLSDSSLVWSQVCPKLFCYSLLTHHKTIHTKNASSVNFCLTAPSLIDLSFIKYHFLEHPFEINYVSILTSSLQTFSARRSLTRRDRPRNSDCRKYRDSESEAERGPACGILISFWYSHWNH